MNQVDIGTFIRECRKEKEMTQEELAESLGVTQKSVSRWENGRTMPDMSLYEPLCRALGIQVSELLYARRISADERTDLGEKTALNMLTTKSKIETFAIFTEILIVVGIIISITLTKFLADTIPEMIITLVSGLFVWGFGLVLRVKIRIMLRKMGES